MMQSTLNQNNKAVSCLFSQFIKVVKDALFHSMAKDVRSDLLNFFVHNVLMSISVGIAKTTTTKLLSV